jgi:hypothetical protein
MTATTNSDLRQDQRTPVLIDGKIAAPGLLMAIDVTIVDLGLTGARLKLSSDLALPENFDLAIATARDMHHCRQTWRRDDFMGIEFTAPPSGDNPWYNPTQATASQSLVSGQDPSPTQKAVSLAAIDVKQAVRLEPSYRLHFARNAANIHRGACSIDIVLHNRETIAAHHPFFCIPDLKLSVRAAEGWEQSEFVSVRKMRRFAAKGEAVLEPGDARHCGTIVLTFKERFGGRVEYEAGSEHQLATLPDFRLTCIAGAGNFPAERSIFVVPAAAIRAAVSDAATSGAPA